ncbi:Superfamily II DNA and RNA helicase [Mariniphaga anaerophila]|uniref:Superfamily II DNA and RNA helicase n=1 Tax=Mariniphaga anaerophila TaxID=1484053 RepID=A0A1M4Y102_9BACT|nr:DEAD/DEAH box helicase [Mariniphaga anaerophila]SHE99266.1 Superfamily II DNA and RNA helicase [Mariniphaga anaerophila]
MKFSELGVHDEILDAISYMGFKDTTPIQEQAIPEILAGKDLIACAQTGTGKTAAFVIPVLDLILDHPAGETTTLILVPTRELAMQIDQQVQGIAYGLGVHSIAIYGGSDGDDWGQQKTALTQGADIVIATPGKLIAHLNLGYVKFDTIKYLILDEADRMLDIGFHEDIMKIISFLPKERQTLMFSATMAPKIRTLASEILVNPEEINISMSKPAEGVLQAVYLCYDNQKATLINHLIADKPDYNSILIFCSTKRKVNELASLLKKNNMSVEPISSDLEQTEREKVLQGFKSRRTRILVATDVLSRGIDIKEINLVINYDVPHDAEDYVHRVGRTARADSTGVALTLVNDTDMGSFHQIEKLIEQDVIKLAVPKEIGTGPEWKVENPRKKQGRKKFNRNQKSKGRPYQNHRKKKTNQ